MLRDEDKILIYSGIIYLLLTGILMFVVWRISNYV